ncbi:hypothetical protein GCM10023096_57180 [Nonomuraea ferruginea]
MLQGGVVELPVVLQTRGESNLLVAGGAQQELERPAHTSPPVTFGNDNTTVSAAADKAWKDIPDAQT